MDLYHNNMSSCAQKVRLVVREKVLAITEKHINLRAGEQNSPAYLALNPKGVVPTLVDRGQPIIESSVICEYLDDVAPQVPLRPADPIERARMRLWTMLPDAGLHHAVGTTCMAVAFRHQILARGPAQVEQYIAGRPDPMMRERLRALLTLGLDAPGVAAAVREYHGFVRKMSTQLARTPWLVGEQFTLADAMALPYVVRLEHLGFQWWWTEGAGGTVLADRSAVASSGVSLQNWLARCKARPSYTAIADYLDAEYLELLSRTGTEARERVKALLA